MANDKLEHFVQQVVIQTTDFVRDNNLASEDCVILLGGIIAGLWKIFVHKVKLLCTEKGIPDKMRKKMIDGLLSKE